MIGRSSDRGFLRQVVETSAFTVAGKGVGLLVPFFIAAWFGATGGTDAFFYAYGMVFLLVGIFGSAVESVVVPFVAESTRREPTDVGSLVFTLQVVLTSIITIPVVGLVVLSPLILPLITAFSPQEAAQVTSLVTGLSPVLVFLVWSSVASGTLNAQQRFNVPALLRGLRPTGALVGMLLLRDDLGIHALVVGYSTGEALRAIVLTSYLALLGNFAIKIRGTHFRTVASFLKVAGYQMAAMGAIQINPIVDKTVATYAGVAAVSILEYANKLYYAGSAVVDSAVAVVFLSRWSTAFYTAPHTDFLHKVTRAARQIAVITGCITLVLLVFRQPIVHLTVGRGEFPAQQLPVVVATYTAFLFGFAANMAGIIYERGFLVMRESNLLLRIALLKVALNLVLSVFFMKLWGTPGIALATSATVVIEVLVLHKLLPSTVQRVVRAMVSEERSSPDVSPVSKR